MIESQAVRDLIVSAVERLIDCKHEKEKVYKGHCTMCGAVHILGVGWTFPNQIQAIASLVNAARAVEKEHKPTATHQPGQDRREHPVSECPERGCLDHENRGC